MKITELQKKEKIKILENFYKSFKTGYEFEDFLKPFLEKMGLDEVHVTKRSKDGGIDLEGIRYGVTDNNEDSVVYKIQAKRYKPETKIGVDVVDRHLGIMNNGEKGIIITTGKFTSPAEIAAKRKNETPIVLIDGLKLVDLCIDYNIGFVYKPIFSEYELKEFYKEKQINKPKAKETYIIKDIKKDITANDIRARILSIPGAIIKCLPKDKKEFNILFNGNILNNISISSDRRYFSKGISEMYRKYGLLSQDNVYNPTNSIWKYDGDTIIVDLIKKNL